MRQRTIGIRVLGICLYILTCWAPQIATAQPEIRLGTELCAAAQGEIPAGSRIALAPPPAAQSPLPIAEVEAIMSRAAQAMCADWLDKPRILAGSAELRAALSLVRNRQGTAAWQETVEATVRREADFVLVGETGLSSGDVTLRLTLVDLDDGRVLVKTSNVVVGDAGPRAAGDPRAAIAASVSQFLDTLPQARDVVTVGRFVNESSGLETAAGQALADMAVEAWLDAANSINAMLRGAPPGQVLRGGPPATGFYLSGTLRLIDRDRFQLILRLSQDGVLRATRTLSLSTLQLPPRLRDMFDPAANEFRETGLGGVATAIATMGSGRLEITTDGGRAGAFPICRATDAERLVRECADSLISLRLSADQSGSLMCVSLDDDGLFYVMLPNTHTAAPALQASRPLILPDDLPLLPDGNRIYWPAIGPPSETLVGCLLYASLPGQLLDRLDRFHGAQLDGNGIATLLSVLRDSGPVAGATNRVRIVD
jgi:hypothetical protein